MRRLALASLILAFPALADPAADEALLASAEAALKAGNAATARKDFDALAQRGVVKAQCALGRLYISGAGGRKDPKLGLDYCRAAAEAGDAPAGTEVAEHYLAGKIAPRNPAAAASLLGRAADQRYGPAAYRLAELYELGDGVPKDPDVAGRWLRVAAEGGERRAPLKLADLLFAKGIKVEQRQVVEEPATQAAAWYMIAAERDPTAEGKSRAREQLELVLGVAPQLKRRAEQLAQDYRRRLPAS